jgi:hypothetical protein
VAEEDCYGEDDHYEEDVYFLAEGAAGKGQGEVCGILLAFDVSISNADVVSRGKGY